MITYILAGIRNRHSGLTYCNVTDTFCFYEIISSTLIVAFLYSLSIAYGVLFNYTKLGQALDSLTTLK